MLPIWDADAFGGVATRQSNSVSGCDDFEAARLSKLISRPWRLFFSHSTQLGVVCFSFVCPKLGYPIFTEVHAFACRASASMPLKSLKASRAAKSLAEFVTCIDQDFNKKLHLQRFLFQEFWSFPFFVRMWPQQSESDSLQTGFPEFLYV